MSGYCGGCAISIADGPYAAASASLLDDGAGRWYGRVTCGAINWLAVQHAGARLSIRLPDGGVGHATVERFTYLLPTQATVTGLGPPPW